ncbi:hypothetical protein LINPERHAP1_LOCUS333 [Linum perenne]
MTNVLPYPHLRHQISAILFSIASPLLLPSDFSHSLFIPYLLPLPFTRFLTHCCSLMSLRGFSPESPPAELRLRLLHAWKLGNPATLDQFFAYGTLWTDNQGVLIQGDSHRDFTSILQKRVAVGSVYVVLNFSVCSPCPSFRTCAFPHCLGITTSTKFELQQSPEPPFLSNAFDFEPIASLPARAHPCPYLPDFVGKVVGAGESNHIERNSIVSPVQKVVVTDARFTTKARPITYTPSKFNTPEKLKKHVEDSYRTIHELHVMHAEGGDSVSRLTLLMLHSSYLYAISFTSLVCRNPVTDARYRI